MAGENNAQDTDNENLKTENQYTEESSKTSESKGEDTKTDDQKDAESAVKEAEKGGATEEELERTRRALAKANKEAQDRRYKLQEWDDLGVDPETVKQWKEERRSEEVRKAEEEGRYQDIIERTRQEAATDREKAEEKVNQMKAQLESYLVDKNIAEAISSEEGIPRLLQDITRKSVKTVLDDSGEYKTVVVDSDGLPRKGEDGSEMSVRDLVKSFKQDPDLQYAFRAPNTSGSGTDSQASATPPSKKPGPKPKRSSMTAKEQRAYVQKHGYQEFSKLPR